MPSGTTSPDRSSAGLASRGKARGRQAAEFWQIPATGWREIAIRTWNETGSDNISLLAAGVAFYSFLAFVPMLAAVVLIYGIISDPSDVPRQMATLTGILPTDAAGLVADQLKSMTETPATHSIVGLVFAILLAIYGAMRGATSVIGALNVTYGERETRGFVTTTALSLGFTIGAALVAVIATLAITAMGLVGTVIQLPAMMAPLLTVGLWIVTAAIASVLIAVVYRYGPNRADARWMWLTPGSAFASIGALLATFLFGLYVSRFAGYNATYGALGAVVSFLMWLYVAAFVVLLGAELNAEIEHQTAKDTTTGGEAPMGERGAMMADTLPGGPEACRGAASSDTREKPPRPSAVKAVAAGMVASRMSGPLGGAHIGILPMALLASGLSLVGRRGRTVRGLACLAGGGLLVWRANLTSSSNRVRQTRKAAP